MEENRDIKKLDAFAKKYVKEIEMEKAPLDFTASIMDKIVLESTTEVTFQSKPLFSKKVWFAIVFTVIALVLSPFKSSEKSWFNFPELNFSFFSKIQLSNFLEINTISNTVMYTILFFGVMFIAQLLFLNNHFNKK